MGGAAAILSILVNVKGISAANAQLSGVNGQLAATGASGSKMGALLKKGLLVGGAAVVALGVGMFKLGEKFDQAYDTIRVGTGATGKTLDGLKDDFKQVVKSVPTDFKSASTAIADINTRLGLTGKPLQQSAKQFLELSRITKTDVADNIKTVTRAFGDWEVKTGDQSAALDKFFRASQSSGATVSELAKQVVQFGAPLRQVGFSLDEATAMFANFEKAGVNTQTMMPGIKMAMKTFFEKGIDPKKGLTQAFKGIEDGSIDASAAIKIFGSRAGGDMIEAVKQGRFKLDDMTKALQNGSDTIMKAGKDTQSFGEKWTVIKNRVLVGLEPLAMRVFDGMGKLMDALPPIADRVGAAINGTAGAVKSAAGWFDRHRTVTLALAVVLTGMIAVWTGYKIAALASAAATAISTSAATTGTAAWIIKQGALLAVAAATRTYTAVQWLLNAAMSANPIGLVVVALVALAAGLVYAYKKSETFRDIVDAAWGAVSGAVGAAWSLIKGVFDAMGSATKSAWDLVGKYIIDPVKDAASAVRNALGSGGLAGWLGDLWNSIRGAANTAWDVVKRHIVEPVREAASAVRGALGQDGLLGWLGAAWQTIRGAATTAWDAFKGNIVEPVKEAATAVKGALGAGADGLITWLGDKVEAMTKAGASIGGAIKGGIVEPVKEAATAVKGASALARTDSSRGWATRSRR